MKQTHAIIAGMVAVNFIGGVICAVVFAPEEISVGASSLIGFPLAVLLFMWCKADIAERKIEQPVGATLLVGLVSVIGVPYYFYRALPWRAATISTLLAIVVFVCLQLTFGIGVYLGQML